MLQNSLLILLPRIFYGFQIEFRNVQNILRDAQFHGESRKIGPNVWFWREDDEKNQKP